MMATRSKSSGGKSRRKSTAASKGTAARSKSKAGAASKKKSARPAVKTTTAKRKSAPKVVARSGGAKKAAKRPARRTAKKQSPVTRIKRVANTVLHQGATVAKQSVEAVERLVEGVKDRVTT